MHGMRQKWAAQKTYRCMQKLWEEYKLASQRDDVVLMLTKISTLLEAFDASHAHLTSFIADSFSLEQAYDEITAVIDRIFSCLDQEKTDMVTTRPLLSELLERAFSVSVILLQDERLRAVFASSPNLINRILKSLEKINGTKTKRQALRLISVLCVGSQNKIALSQNEGFHKLMKHLVEGDRELSREVVRMVRRLLEPTEVQRTDNMSDTVEVNPTLLGEKLNALWSEVKNVVVNELNRTFPNFLETCSDSSTLNPASDVLYHLIPSKQVILEALERLEGYLGNSTNMPEKEVLSKSHDELCSFLRMKGALRSFTQTLSSNIVDFEEKIEIMEAICRMVYRNSSCKTELGSVDGYSKIAATLIKFTISEADTQTTSYLHYFFQMIFAMTVDGNADYFVGDPVAFKMLFSIATKACFIEVRRLAIMCIRDLLTLNSSNAAVVWQLGEIDSLFSILSKTSKTEATNSTLFIDLGISDMTSVGDDRDTKQSWKASVSSSPLYDYIVQIINTLNYLSVVLSNHNFYILHEYTRLLMELDWPVCSENNQIVVLILRSVARLLEDSLAKFRVENQKEKTDHQAFNLRLDLDKFLTVYLQLCRRIYGMDGRQQRNPTKIGQTLVYDHLIRDQYLLLLEIVALLIELSDRDFERFNALMGWDILKQAVLRTPDVHYICDTSGFKEVNLQASPVEVVEVALWMIGEYNVHSCSHALDRTKVRPDSSASRLTEATNTSGISQSVQTEQRMLLTSLLSACSEPLITKFTKGSKPLFAESISDLLSQDSGIESSSSGPQSPWLGRSVDCIDNDGSYDILRLIRLLRMIEWIFATSKEINIEVSEELKSRFCAEDGIEKLIILLRIAVPVPAMHNLRKAVISCLTEVLRVSQVAIRHILAHVGLDMFFEKIGACRLAQSEWQWFLAIVLQVTLQSSDSKCDIFHILANFKINPQVKSIDRFVKDNNSTISSMEVNDICNNVQESTVLSEIGSDTLNVFLQDIREPKPLFKSRVPPSVERFSSIHDIKRGVFIRSGSLQSIDSNFASFTKSVPRKSSKSVDNVCQTSSKSKAEEARPRSTADVPLKFTMTKIPTSSKNVHSVHRSRNSKRFSGTLHDNINLAVLSPSGSIHDDCKKVQVSEIHELHARHLAGFVFRNKETVAASIRLLATAQTPLVINFALDLVTVINLLIDCNSQNADLWSEPNIIKILLRIYFLARDEFPCSIVGPFEQQLMDLLTKLMSYQTSTDQIALLFKLTSCDNYSLHECFKELIFCENGDLCYRFGKGYSIFLNDEGLVTLDRIRHQSLVILKHISKARFPPVFFSFDGISSTLTSAAIEKFPSPKTGFSLCAWFKVMDFTREEIPFLHLGEISKTGSFLQNRIEVLFRSVKTKRLPPLVRKDGAIINSLTNDRLGCKYHLCLKLRHVSSPAEDFVFDSFDFCRYLNQWVLLTITHQKQEFSLYINGDLVQTVPSLIYPKPPSTKDRSLVIYAGGPWMYIEDSIVSRNSDEPKVEAANGWRWWWSTSTTTSNVNTSEDQQKAISLNSGYFLGQIGPITLFESCLNCAQVQLIHNLAPGYRKSLKIVIPDIKHFMVIHPFANLGAEQKLWGSNCSLPLTERPNTNLSSTHSASINTSRKSFRTSVQHRSLVTYDEEIFTIGSSPSNISSGCSIHEPSTFDFLADDIDVSKYVMSLICCRNELFSDGLELMHSLWQNNVNRRALDCQNNVWATLMNCFLANPDMVTYQLFAELLKIMLSSDNSQNEPKIEFTEPLALYFDLIMVTNIATQEKALRQIVETILSCEENKVKFRELFGFELVFEMLCCLTDTLYLDILKIFESLLQNQPDLSSLTKIFDFLAYDPKEYLAAKAALLHKFADCCSANPALLELIRTSFGINVLIELLDSSSSSLKCASIRLIGMNMHQMNSKNSRAFFQKNMLFEVMEFLLGSNELTAEICESILILSFDLFTTDAEQDTCTEQPEASTSLRRLSQKLYRLQHATLVYPEGIELLLNLMKTSTTDLIVHVVTDIRRCLIESNLFILWDCPWADWISSFMNDKSVVNNPYYSKIYDAIDLLIQKIMIFDIRLRKGASQTSRLRGAITEDENFQIMIAKALFSFFHANPCLPQATAADIIRNMVLIFRHLEEYVPFSVDMSTKFVLCVDRLSHFNNAEVRKLMSALDLYQLRDDAVIQILLGTCPLEQTRRFVNTFSFDHVADQPQFRDHQGLVLLFNLLHASPLNREFQVDLLKVMVNVFLHLEENRKQLAKLIDDVEIIRRLSSITVQRKVSHDGDLSVVGSIMFAENEPLELFLDWYYSAVPDVKLKRRTVEQRIEAMVNPLITNHLRAQEKVAARRNKRAGLYKDRLLKHTLTVNKVLSDFKTKSAQRLLKCAAHHQQRQDALRRARHDRRKLTTDVQLNGI